MTDLLTHIKAENAMSRIWMDAKPGRYAGMVLEDVKYWAEMGVHTVEDYQRYTIESEMSDLAKAAYGTRAACPDTTGMTLKELYAEHGSLVKAAEEAYAAEQVEEQEAIAQFEALIAHTIEMGAGDRATALRWIRDAHTDEMARHDDDYFCYLNGLPYGYLNTGDVR